MAPRKKGTKRTTTRNAGAKTAQKSARKGAKKSAKRTTKSAAKKGAKKAGSSASSSRPKTVKFETRKNGVFTQNDLMDQVHAWNPDLSRAQARQVVNDVLDTLQTAIKKTDKIRLKGVGTITKKKIPARKGGKLVKNPFTGEMVKQKARPASIKVKLTPAREIKES